MTDPGDGRTTAHAVAGALRSSYPRSKVAKRSEGRKRPSKEQVKVWLSTVVAPLVGALRVETERAAQGGWSFRSTTQDFEFLWPTDRVVSEFYRANLEQFWRYHPAMRRVAAKHDEALTKLRQACRNAFERLTQSEDFGRLAAATGSRPEEWQFFAQYVVNGVRDLDSYVSSAELWRQKGAEFLALRERPALAESFQAVSETGSAFHIHARSLLRELEKAQRDLADEFQLPPVDPVATATV